jgi:osmotically-inducible protein OsmY
MAHAPTVEQRPDVDIHGEIDHLIAHYPPLQHDRHQITITVESGVVTVRGNLQSGVTHRYLLNNLPELEGVVAVNAEALYNDEVIRLEAGRVVPPGVVVARVRYGQIVLGGRLPAGTAQEAVTGAAAQIPGVTRVLTSFVS